MKIPTRLTGVILNYFQKSGGNPQVFETRYSREIDSDDVPFQSHFKLTQSIRKIDRGWVSGRVALLRIENNEGKGLMKIPTPEEASDTAKRVVCLCADGVPILVVRPGEVVFFEPAENVFDKLTLNSKHKECSVSVVVFPGGNDGKKS